jgi:superfamily I DNA/RNA helicase
MYSDREEAGLARLAIAKDFLAEYAGLEKPVRSAVESAMEKFAEHTHAGVHLEKLAHGKDDRIRTIRIDSFWRGVVLAPESGDTYCLLRVLPHDKAIKYAASRRFSVNQVLGVLEVRNEEALQQLEPSLQATAGTADKRLFDHVSDADMRRLGVDAALLPVVRLLASETHLEALETVLPEAQYAALYALACGMSPEEAWAQVAQYLPAEVPPESVDAGDLVSAMERTPGQVAFVSGQEELRDILAHPFAAWRIFLHASQRKVAYRPSYAGPAQVSGGAGTGKTVTALHRAACLAQRYAQQAAGTDAGAPEEPPILLTTFTRNLADALGGQLDLLTGDEAVRGQVEVLNVDKLAYRIVSQARGTPRIADTAQLRERWAQAAGADPAFTAAFLQHEWEQVILGQDVRTERAYLTCLRTGRGRPLTRTQRSQVWQITRRIEAELRDAGEATHLQLASEAARLLREAGRTLYRHVIVDEAQDLHPAQWRLLRAAVPPGPDDLFIAADPHQRIYDNKVSLASLGIGVRGRTSRLTINYRTTAEILAWAIPLLGEAPVTGLDGDADILLGYRSATHGPRPQVRRAATREEELSALAARIRGWLDDGIEPHAIAVAARSGHLAGQARDALKAAGIRTLALATRSATNAVRAGTMHGMKGLEFQAVAVIGADDGTVPAASALTPASEDPLAHAQDIQRERCVLFVACTRARDHLYISYSGEPSPFLARAAG